MSQAGDHKITAIYDDTGDQRIKANRESYIRNMKLDIIRQGFDYALEDKGVLKDFQQYIDTCTSFIIILKNRGRRILFKAKIDKID